MRPRVLTQEQLSAVVAQFEARERQRERQQGLGRPIISATIDGWRVVAVGNGVAYSKSWLTFHDFLLQYLKDVMGRDWWSAELARPELELHPLVRWHHGVQKFLRDNRGSGKASGTHSATMTGVVRAYLGLAYHLYLLAHNATLQRRLLARLRTRSEFAPAAYETFVAATFINAGFRLELEDESDVNSTHCEFTATHNRSGRQFSVEAKWRSPGKASTKVANQLHAALKKTARHERIVFIELSTATASVTDLGARLHEAVDSLRAKEQGMSVAKQAAPPAYVVLTNQSHLIELESAAAPVVVVAEGFKIPDFKFDLAFSRLRDALAARDRHRDVFDLVQSIHTYHEIPTTFDGEIPEFAFGTDRPRLLVGQKYQVPTEHGVFVPGALETGTVIPSQKRAMCSLRLDDGHCVLASFELTPDELSAYARHPETFFGVHIPQSTKADTPIELYDWFFRIYGNTPKEKLIEFMKGHPNYDSLLSKDQPELASLYCEGMTEAVVLRDAREKASALTPLVRTTEVTQ